MHVADEAVDQDGPRNQGMLRMRATSLITACCGSEIVSHSSTSLRMLLIGEVGQCAGESQPLPRARRTPRHVQPQGLALWLLVPSAVSLCNEKMGRSPWVEHWVSWAS